MIGTGAGGAPVAKELAEGGMSVVMLEEGEHLTTDDFTARPREMSHAPLPRRRPDRDRRQCADLLPLGRGVGGTTMINSGTCFRTPEPVLEMWGERFGLDELTPTSSTRTSAASSASSNVVQVPEDLAGKNALVVKRGADALGWTRRLHLAERPRLRRLRRVQLRLPDVLGSACARRRQPVARRVRVRRGGHPRATRRDDCADPRPARLISTEELRTFWLHLFWCTFCYAPARNAAHAACMRCTWPPVN